jgi:hypothetical protein
VLDKKLDKVKLDNYITTLRDMKLGHIDGTFSDRETNLTSNMKYGVNSKIIEYEDVESTCSVSTVSNKNANNVIIHQKKTIYLDGTVSQK